jgi:radical SAM protein with 4Fe4S-binding SPASM domain
MIDINFYMDMCILKRALVDDSLDLSFGESIEEYFDKVRSKKPTIFNIETTNACSMSCSFCPRTTLMTRPVKTMEPELFKKIIDQVEPHSEKRWNDWVTFAEEYYGVPRDEQSENAFFLYVVPKVITLHGFGDPLLDKNIPEYIGMLTGCGIPSYFSCNPANINIDRVIDAMNNGLDYLKFSIDSLTDSARGMDAFDKDYPKIMDVLIAREQFQFKTQIVITMIDLGQDQYEDLKKAFEGTGVYIYLKSLDQAWMLETDTNNKSIHWNEFCQYPWSSMTIMADGLVVPCAQDYNSEMVMGDANVDSLEKIWNSHEYDMFRRIHIENVGGIRCTTPGKCDMRVVGKFL